MCQLLDLELIKMSSKSRKETDSEIEEIVCVPASRHTTRVRGNRVNYIFGYYNMPIFIV